MESIMNLESGWYILQDVHDTGEELGLYKTGENFTEVGPQLSEWEELDELKHLQLLFASQPYFGRELRYFNQAPWWYKQEFELQDGQFRSIRLCFSNVDYYCKVWVNGHLAGEHEGYSAPFSFDITDYVRPGRKNLLIVKVSSPWDEEVEKGKEESRTILVRRRMVKGTYEHSDTFIQRDVNPVGIYGSVRLMLAEQESMDERPEITYQLHRQEVNAGEAWQAHVSASVFLRGMEPGTSYKMVFRIRDRKTGILMAESVSEFCGKSQEEKRSGTVRMENVRLWDTWDSGQSWMYTAEIHIERDGRTVCQKESPFAFRTVEMERTKDKTLFRLNGRKFFVRGTSYYPDCYISAMTKERYYRDLLNIKAAGFNLVRVHVHVEQDIFYELCDEMGIAVIQDSEYNWTHPSTDEWAEKFIGIYQENVRMLMGHPSIICWIGMNEPGCVDPDGDTQRRFMEENPGPRLYRELQEMDPSRPIIKGSFCHDDICSGDSHNYLGSLTKGEYRDIYGTTEKLNTEYGFDAPASAESLKKEPVLYRRLAGLEKQIPKIQDYQYKLLKYYTEHYRIQKYNPCSGYVQFMFIDLCPQSFYGLYDWWGIPKKGLQAMLESNAPVGIFAKYRDTLDGIYAVNDTAKRYEDCEVRWVITETESKKIVVENTVKIQINPDSVQEVAGFEDNFGEGQRWNLYMCITDRDGVCLAQNFYEDIFALAPRVKGHPDRMSHETGMRIYWA